MQIDKPTRRRFACTTAGAIAASSGTLFGAAGSPDIKKAMQAVRAVIATAESDPRRPGYHFRPPAQWNNDPNGTIFYKGWHHLFYQHNPFGAQWGNMHWGHARSRDLVNWQHLPIALWPSRDKGEEHVFSGCAHIAADGRPRLFYTSIGNRHPEQWMAEPLDDDLIAWRKFEGNPVLTIAAHGDRRPHDWRDPFLFEENGKTYMVLGGNRTGRRSSGGGMVYLYVATKPDLTAWKFLGPVFEYRNREIINIECPNLFKLGSKWVLLISPQKPCEYFIRSLDIARIRFQPESHGVLDPGTAYASNISVDDAGRTLLWLWGRTETDPDKGWNSTMVLPRVLTIGDDGFLRQNPAPEFEQLRGEVRRHAPADLHPSKPLSLSETIAGDSLEIDATFSIGTAKRVGLRLRGAGTEQGIPVFYGAHPANFPPDAGFSLGVGTAGTLIGKDRRIRIRVFLDKRVIEAYANDGAAAIFTYLDPTPNHTSRIEAYAEGGSARLESLTAWPLKGANFSLENFRV